MERGYCSALTITRHVFFVTFFALDVGEVKHTLKVLEIRKRFREEKVEQGPEFRQIVLKRSTGEDETGLGGILFELFDKLAIEVLQAVPLILEESVENLQSGGRLTTTMNFHW